MNGDNTSATPSYRLLTEEQIKKIHEATLHVLEKVGVKVAHEEARELAKKAGCTIKDENIVLIPRSLVEESIKSAPSSIHIYDQLGNIAMKLEGRNNYYGLGTDLKFTYDVFTGETRESKIQDVKNAAIITDYCENIDFCASFALPGDVETNIMYVECAKAEMENTTKPIFFTAGGKEDLDLIVKMAHEITGGEVNFKAKPFLVHYSEPTAPLMHSLGAVRKLFYCAENDVPICYVPGVLMGASGPVTLAGGIVQANAESLSGIVLSQLKKKVLRLYQVGRSSPLI